jgi:hypothetical protein
MHCHVCWAVVAARGHGQVCLCTCCPADLTLIISMYAAVSCCFCCCVHQATSAALGYLLLFVDQVALIMGGPMLHESAHQASTSSIWQPSSFWNRQPPSPAAMLPLNVMTAGAGAGSGTGQAAYNSTTSRWGVAGSSCAALWHCTRQ